MVFSFRRFSLNGIRTSHVPRPLDIATIAQDRQANWIEPAGQNAGMAKESHTIRRFGLPGGLWYRLKAFGKAPAGFLLDLLFWEYCVYCKK